MGCPSSVVIGNTLTFSICTHDPDTGQLADADTLPAYRVYEDETATPILTGTMAKLDDANTLGFYTERITCSAANGFENGKMYTIYIEATVDSTTGGIAYGFAAETATWSAAERTLTQSAAQVAAIVAGTAITITRGDTVTIALTGLGSLAGRTKLWFTVKQALSMPDTGAVLQVEETGGLLVLNGAAAATETDGSITVNNETLGNVTIVLKAAATAALDAPASLTYDVQMLTASGVTTLTKEDFGVVEDVTRVIV
jgi:hypothetical protein